jgi:hypothetical protein
MILDLTAIAHRARVAVLVAAMAWLFGLTPPPGTRVALLLLVAAAFVIDQWLTQQQPTRTIRIPAPRNRQHA